MAPLVVPEINTSPNHEDVETEQPEVEDTHAFPSPLEPPPLDADSDLEPQEEVYRPIPVWARTPVDTESRLEIPPDEPADVDFAEVDEPTVPGQAPVPPWLAHRQGAVAGRRPEAHQRQEMPAPGPSPQPVQARGSRLGWLWSALLGGLLGGLLGLALATLGFILINGALDISRTRGVADLRAQLGELSTQLDAVRTDTSTLQGSVDQLQQEVETLSGLPARVSGVETDIETLNDGVEALQQENAELRASLDSLGEDVDVLATELDELQIQAERTVSFFEQLRDLLTDTFGEGP